MVGPGAPRSGVRCVKIDYPILSNEKRWPSVGTMFERLDVTTPLAGRFLRWTEKSRPSSTESRRSTLGGAGVS